MTVIATAAELDALPPGSVVSYPFGDIEGNVAERVHDGWLITGEEPVIRSADLFGMAEDCRHLPFTVLREGFGEEHAWLPEPCPYDFSHTRHWCGDIRCRAS